MRGRKKTPTNLKVLRLTGKRAEKLLAKQTPTPGALAEAPDWLTDEQKEAWAYAIDNAPRDILRRADKAVLAAFVIAEDTHRRASIAMQKSQLLVKSPKQELPIQNPYMPIVNRQMVLMMRAASELGFTPCARARIDASNTERSGFGEWEDVETA